MFSTQVLQRANLYTGVLQPGQGNALSGLMDVSFRRGYTARQSTTLQLGVIGLEAASEGPLGDNSSYLASYRYSTVGLLAQLGVDFGGEDIRYQDLSFSIGGQGSKGGSYKFFGLWGRSSNRFTGTAPEEAERQKDFSDIDYLKDYGLLGITNSSKLGKQLYWQNTLAVSLSSDEYSVNSKQYFQIDNTYYEYSNTRFNDENDQLLISLNSSFSGNIGANNYYQMGLLANFSSLRDKEESQQFFEGVPTGNAYKLDVSAGNYTLQPYLLLHWQLSTKFLLRPGLHLPYYSQHSQAYVEPRIAAEWQLHPQHQLAAAYGLQSQLQTRNTFSFALNPNTAELLPVRMQQAILGYTYRHNQRFQLKTELYWRQLWQAPVVLYASSGSGTPGRPIVNFALNGLEQELPNPLLVGTFNGMRNNGKGRNYGVEVGGEYYSRSNSYLLASVAVFNAGVSEVENNNRYRPSQFDAGYSASVSFGREWQLKQKESSSRSFSADARLLAAGGMYQPGLIFIYDEQREQLPAYFRPDLRLALRKQKPGYTRTVSLDFQNVANVQNVGWRYYDSFLEEEQTQYQLGILPLLSWRVSW
jgi:hypothetical protein